MAKIIGGTTTTPIRVTKVNNDEVSTSLWDSKTIVDRLCQPINESGSIVSCYPVDGYPLEVKTDSEATNITRCGKNLIPFPYNNGKYVAGYVLEKVGVTFTVLDDGGIYVKGTPTEATYFVVCQNVDFGTGTISSQNKPNGATNGTCAASIDLYYNATSASKSVTLTVKANVEYDTVYYPQIEAGTVCTAYEPYVAETLTADPSGTTVVVAMSGCNSIRADKGEVTVIGAEDPKHTIEQLRKAIGS